VAKMSTSLLLNSC